MPKSALNKNHSSPDRAFKIFSEVTQLLSTVSPSEFLRQLPTKVCEILSVSVCILWKFDKSTNSLGIIGSAGEVKEHFKKIELSLDTLGVKVCLASTDAAYLADVTRENRLYLHSIAAKEHGWVSLLSAPIRRLNSLVGMLEIYTNEERHFAKWEKSLIAGSANLVAVTFQKEEILLESKNRLMDSQRLEKMAAAMLEISKAHNSNHLRRLLVKTSLELLPQGAKGTISKFDYQTGEHVFVVPFEKKFQDRRLQFGEGLTGQAVLQERPIRVGDVSQETNYLQVLDDTRSELVIPIIIKNAQVRTGQKIEFASKILGALNFEHPSLSAFSDADEKCLQTFAEQAALMLERLEADENRKKLRQFENKIAASRDYDHTIELVLDGIAETLGFDFINISLVMPEMNTIETKYVRGLKGKEVEDFKKMAVHPLSCNDIQAYIVRAAKIEAPKSDDSRLDPSLASQFNLLQLVRLYVPMTFALGQQPIGVVEVGYKQGFQKYIYENDVQILKGFVDYAVQALELKKSGLIDKFSHEFKSPIVGIRNNASFLQKRIKTLTDDFVQKKLEDMLTDCEILFQQTRNLEYLLGRNSPTVKPANKIERTVVFRDVVIKTINQLTPLLTERGFRRSNIDYPWYDSNRIVVWVNKANINQVIYNLLMNSIKYAENEKEAFRIHINILEDSGSFIIRFADWGIGIRQGLEEKIFEDGFRSTEAIEKNVSGGGLGLTIARKIMRDIGGDLRIARLSKPTEFQMVLPKSLKESPL